MELSESIWKEYTKLNFLGYSENSKAYKAKSKKGNKTVVIKEYSKRQKNSEALYYNEIKYMKELESENTIKCIKNEETKDYYYIIREFHYGTLDEFIKIHPNGLSIKEIQKILLDLSIPFKLLNKKNLIHKDIKPSNILFSYDEKNNAKSILSGVYLTQKLGEKNDIEIKPLKYICPPEILKGKEYDMKSDIWSLGILIYFLIKGNYPFNEKRDMVILREIDKGIDLNISKDNDLNDLLKNTLEKDVEKRFSWNEFFNHQFLKKKIIDKNVIFKEILKIKKEINNVKKKSILTIRDYGILISTYGNDEILGKIYEDNISKPIKQAYMDLVQILYSLKFNG